MTSPVQEAVVLAGGLGTRLKPVVAGVPKPLAPVAGRPFLAYLLDKLERAGLGTTCPAGLPECTLVMDGLPSVARWLATLRCGAS